MAATIAAAIAAAGLAATATAQDRYTDVTSTSHRSHKANIDALDSSGVFDGTECGARKFCPGEPANRWTVAVWIVRVIDGRDPVPVTESRFADVDDNEWWMPYVERLADLGITVGCETNPLRYCPYETVTRARMASFLVRAFRLQRAESAEFTDTRGSTHEANIDALFAAGLTVGCKQRPLRYCPNNPVSRAQMASLLNRGLERIDQRGDRRDDRDRRRRRRRARSPTARGRAAATRRSRPPGGAPVRSVRTRRSPAGEATTATENS